MAKLNSSVETSKKLSTNDVRTPAQLAVCTGIKAGELTEEGMMFQFMEMRKSAKPGKFGDFWFINGLDMEGNEVEILTSAQKLVTLINNNYELLVNKIITLSGVGQGFDRNYLIDVIGPGNIRPKV
jgi:hypothetical protein